VLGVLMGTPLELAILPASDVMPGGVGVLKAQRCSWR
jgi:hypothetical protein